MDMRKYLPLILIAFLAIFLLPQLLNRGDGKSKTLPAEDKAALTRDAVERIDRGEQKYLARYGSYTSNLSDLVAGDRQLARNLTIGLSVEIDVGADGKNYLVRASSDVLSLARARTGKKITATSCRVLKSSSKVKCPEPAQKPEPGSTTNTTTTG